MMGEVREPWYRFKQGEELGWAVAVAVVVVVLQALADFNPEKVGDWKVWAVGIGAAAVRAGAGAALAYFSLRK